MSGLTRMEWDRDILWLVAPSWCVSVDSMILDGIAKAREALPESHSICMLVNEPADIETFSKLDGVRAEYVSNNIFVPVDTFDVHAREKYFDAVVNAVPAPFKRTHLCSKIDDLCCLRRQPEIYDFTRDDVYDAAELKPKVMNHRSISKPEVARFLNESYCGVILSEIEGNCRAAAEYLYCGLPVVSTPSLGGRAEWFDDYNSIIVEPDADQVRDAVLALKERVASGAISAPVIRANALDLRRSFLDRLEGLLSEYLTGYGLATEVSAGSVTEHWLAVVEEEMNELKHFPDEAAAHAYISRVGA